jgi:signal transduction histidine kinase
MFRKLHTRLLWSHTLPILILTPALAIVLYYLVQTQNTLGDLANQLIGQGTLIVQIAQDEPDVWTQPDSAARLIDRLEPNIASRIMLIDRTGHLLASSLAADASRIGAQIGFPVVREARAGRTNWLIDYSPYMRTRILDMAIPVFDRDDHQIGILRLSYDITAIEQRTIPLRSAIIVAFIIGALLALLLSFRLARSLNAPLLRLTQSISKVPPGSFTQELPETGPDEIRLLAQNYNAMMRRLRELEANRRQIIANLVHELGTPLGAIKAASEALRNGAAADPALASELTVGINYQIDQMRLLMDDLALLGESELREITLEREWCDLETLILSQCQLYAYWAKQKRIDLSFDVDTELPPVFVDPRRVGQILGNLLYNAYKYSPSGSKISVNTRLQPPNVCIEVRDNGPGIAPEEQARIFELLYRSPHQRNLYKGMGLGLALSRRLAEAHGGTITVQSVLGEGATFIVSLPLAQDRLASP